jgi:hypothetical protein
MVFECRVARAACAGLLMVSAWMGAPTAAGAQESPGTPGDPGTPESAIACDPNYAPNASGQCVPVSPGGVTCAELPGSDFPVVGSDVYGLDQGATPGLACDGTVPTDVAGSVETQPQNPQNPQDAQNPQLAQTGRWSGPMAVTAIALLITGWVFTAGSLRLQDRLRGGFTVTVVGSGGQPRRHRVTSCRGCRRS